MYVIPAKKGHHKALLIDSIQHPAVMKELGWITSADQFENNFVLLGSSFVLEQPFTGRPSFNELTLKEIQLGHFSQKESVTYTGSKECLISDEFFSGLGGPRLFHFSWSQTNAIDEYTIRGLAFYQLENRLHLSSPIHRIQSIEIYDTKGNQIRFVKVPRKAEIESLRLDDLKSATYFAIIRTDTGLREVRKFHWSNAKN